MPRFAPPVHLALLITLALAVDLEKDICSPSLLQIGSSVHEVSHLERTAQHFEANTARHKHLALLQVSAKTGEVSQFVASHKEDGEAPYSSNERHRDLSNLLSHADHPKSKDKDAESESNNAGEDAGEDVKKQSSHGSDNAESNEGDRTSQPGNSKPDAQGLQGARIAPFGKEDTARELQHHAQHTQDTLVDAIENAEVAEIKRSIFRSLTRLRAAEIKEFDTIARLETQAIDEYNDNHHYRKENPLDYIGGDHPVEKDKLTSFH